MAVLIGSLGSVGMWSVVVALPVVQTEFGATRGTASLAFTLVMLGFGSGGVLTGKITDRYGIVTAIGLGIGILGPGLYPRGDVDLDLAVHPGAFRDRACPRRPPSAR